MNEETLLTEVRAMTGVVATQVSDVDLHTLVDVAIDEYVTYHPDITFTADSGYLTTVANQPNYAIPSDSLWIIEVFWNPSTDDWSTIGLSALMSDYDPAHPVDLTIIYRQVAAIRKYFGGHWKILNGEIWLIPTPSNADTKVAMLYATTKTISDLSDIPDFLFKRLLAGLLMQRRARDLIQESGFRAGAYAVNQSVGQSMEKTAEKELATVRQRLAQAYTGITDYTNTRPFGIRQ